MLKPVGAGSLVPRVLKRPSSVDKMAVNVAIGLLHPGSMGAEVGRCLVAAGHRVMWASEGRSAETIERASSAGLEDVCLEQLVNDAQYIFSICPPASALDVAKSVKQLGFTGTYVDTNAIAPSTSEKVAQLFEECKFVDGSIIGEPPKVAGTTRLYFSGAAAVKVSRLFHATALLSMPLKGTLTAASSLKMAYAAWTKGTAALLLNARALADGAGVGDALDEEWSISQPGLVERSANIPGVCGPNAWCWTGEMEEVAKTFDEAGLPGRFHTAAAEVYTRLSSLKGRERSPPNLAEAMSLLNGPKRRKV